MITEAKDVFHFPPKAAFFQTLSLIARLLTDISARLLTNSASSTLVSIKLTFGWPFSILSFILSIFRILNSEFSQALSSTSTTSFFTYLERASFEYGGNSSTFFYYKKSQRWDFKRKELLQ